jgi:hypothetical protein
VESSGCSEVTVSTKETDSAVEKEGCKVQERRLVR